MTQRDNNISYQIDSILTDVDIPAGARVAPFSLLDGDAPARGV